MVERNITIDTQMADNIIETSIIDDSEHHQPEAPMAPATPSQRPTKDMMELGFTDAVRAYYRHDREGGKYAAEVVLRGAALLRDFEMTNKDFSELLKVGEPGLGSAKDALLAGEPVPIRVVQPVRGAEYIELKGHPYKQHGRVWRQLCHWQAGLNTSAKDVEAKVELDVAAWPEVIKIKGQDYARPVDALLDNHGLVTTHTAWANVIRPQVVDLSNFSPQTKKGRMVAALENVRDMSITLRVFSKEQNREQKKSFKLSELKQPEVFYAAAAGIIGMALKRGGIDVDDRQRLIAFLKDGTHINAL